MKLRYPRKTLREYEEEIFKDKLKKCREKRRVDSCKDCLRYHDCESKYGQEI